MKKLYIVVRSDLAPGAQCAQSCHAMSAFADAYPELHREWHRNGQNLVVVAIESEAALVDLASRAAIELRIPAAGFHEPDFNNELTAVAFGAEVQRLVSSLPLALKRAA